HGGVDGFLSRRSSRFRRNLRRAERRAQEEGITFRWHTNTDDEASRQAMYRRALAVDDRSWKGRAGQGLNASNMARFYDRMTMRLGREQRLRFVFAERDGQTLAMGFGGSLGAVFRGLQMSYDDDFRQLSLGNLIQWSMIQNLVGEGVEHYDLGTDIGYKARWGEPGLETVSLVVRA
ncbi:MAG: GNAT family N-acetyltransferase, partial [Myxococcota bacterium]|nr:GNAT family N-acetyltransferase [Myxococcota bacterium]